MPSQYGKRYTTTYILMFVTSKLVRHEADDPSDHTPRQYSNRRVQRGGRSTRQLETVASCRLAAYFASTAKPQETTAIGCQALPEKTNFNQAQKQLALSHAERHDGACCKSLEPRR